ncbi:MAG: hypothetical protein RL404_2523, partial [Pseudomonadota bacterium]
MQGQDTDFHGWSANTAGFLEVSAALGVDGARILHANKIPDLE